MSTLLPVPEASVSRFPVAVPFSPFMLMARWPGAPRRHDIMAVEQSCQLVFCIWIQTFMPILNFYSFPILYTLLLDDATSRRHPSTSHRHSDASVSHQVMASLAPTVYTTNLPPRVDEEGIIQSNRIIESLNIPTEVVQRWSVHREQPTSVYLGSR